MTKKIFLSMMMVVALGFTFVSCSDDNKETVTGVLNVIVETPLNLDNAELVSATADVISANGRKVATITSFSPITTAASDENGETTNTVNRYSGSVEVPIGVYNVEISGKIRYAVEKNEETGEVLEYTERDIKGSVVKIVTEGETTANEVTIPLEVTVGNGGFVISEIFFTGTTTPEGKQYSGGDGYIIITNNSDEVLYADSIAVLESTFLTTSKYDYEPNIMNEAFTAQAIYMIPGTGKDVPVQPGKSLVLAINAIDHREANPNSMDLTGADFEFYDESSNPRFTDPDGPAPNLDKWYCYTATVFSFHNRGFRAYAIAKMQGTKEDFLVNNVYEAGYKMEVGGNVYEMGPFNYYKVPNSWIVDAVNLSIESWFEWIVTSPTLDSGWTYCGKVNADQNRYNKSVIRKKDANGKYIDTNNSTNDFEPEAQPSLLVQ